MVSQAHWFILMDPSIFPDPYTFDPERWIRAAAKGERLDKYLVNFSRGSRICLGKKYWSPFPRLAVASTGLFEFQG